MKNFILIREGLSVSREEDGIISGQLVVANSNIQIIKDLEGKWLSDVKDVNGTYVNVDKLIVGAEISLLLHPMKVTNYYETMNDFLVKNKDRLPRQLYYIHEDRYFSDANEKTDRVLNYEKIIKLIDLLSNISDYEILKTGYKELLFIQSRKASLELKYDESALNYGIDKLEVLEGDFGDEKKNFEERTIIFKNELIAFVLDKQEHYSIKNLLQDWNSIYANYKHTYSCYLEGFSCEKIKNELDSEKLELSKKLHDVVDNIGTKIISIPIGYFLIIAQFDFKGEKVEKNILLIVISLLFTFFINVLLVNQKKQLSIIDEYIARIEDRFKSYKQLDKSLLNDVVISLRRTERCQQTKIIMIQFIIWFVFIITSLVFLFSHYSIAIVFFFLLELIISVLV